MQKQYSVKKLWLSILLFTLGAQPNVQAQQVIITDDASYTTPASGAVLDVKSTSKGFMLPRVALVSLTDQTTIASPSTGLMVYNTGTGGLTEKGVYFWNGTVWEKGLTGGNGSADYVKIATDGTLTLNGGATTYDDLVVNPYTAVNNGQTKPKWTLFAPPSMSTWEYIDGNDAELFFMVQLPHNYRIGSTIYPHIHWSAISALGTNRVTWGLDYQWVNHAETFSSTTSTTATGYTLVGSNPERSVAAYEHVITPIPASGIAGTGKGISSILLCRLYRKGTDTNDTFTGSAFLLSFDFHYEIDSFGSKEEYVK